MQNQRNYPEKHDACVSSLINTAHASPYRELGSLKWFATTHNRQETLNWRILYFIPLADKMHCLFSVATQITCTHRLLLLNFKSSQELRCVSTQKEEHMSVFVQGEKGFYF